MARKYLHQNHLPRLLLNSDSTDPPNNQTISNNSLQSGGQWNFDGNMVIILAALLCALICALGLNSIVRCALRCSRGFAAETSDERLGSKGVKMDVLRGIPVVPYKNEMDARAATDCVICLAEFSEGEKVRVLPDCDHRFHVKCIDTWLRSHSSCPTCRKLLSHHSSTAYVPQQQWQTQNSILAAAVL